MSNYGTSNRRANVLPIVIGIIVVLSLLPTKWLGWTSDLADLVRIPVTPVSHVGMIFTNWIRPAVELSDMQNDERERKEFVTAERDHYRQLYHAHMLRANEFASQLRELQNLPESSLRNPRPPLVLTTDLTGIRSGDISGIVELKRVGGATSRILVGDIAIVGRDIVGRISRLGATRIELRTSTHSETGLIRAAVVSAHPDGSSQQTLLHEVLLESDGTGKFSADSLASSEIKVGDLVVLNDPVWPESGAGLILGLVTKINRLDEAPLRQSLTIEPRRRVRDVSRVVVLGTGTGDASTLCSLCQGTGEAGASTQ